MGLPIGVGEVRRRVCGKCVMMVAKEDVVEASGHLSSLMTLIIMITLFSGSLSVSFWSLLIGNHLLIVDS